MGSTYQMSAASSIYPYRPTEFILATFTVINCNKDIKTKGRNEVKLNLKKNTYIQGFKKIKKILEDGNR